MTGETTKSRSGDFRRPVLPFHSLGKCIFSRRFGSTSRDDSTREGSDTGVSDSFVTLITVVYFKCRENWTFGVGRRVR